MSLPRKTAALSAIALVTALAPATAARAAPDHCMQALPLNGDWGWAACFAGTGSVRAVLTCSGETQKKTTRYGPWVGIGQESWAYCPAYLPWAIYISGQYQG